MTRITQKGSLSVATLCLTLLISVVVLAGLLIFVMKHQAADASAVASSHVATDVSSVNTDTTVNEEQSQKSSAWPLPNTLPMAERLAWNSQTMTPCGQWCKQLTSQDGLYILTLTYVPEEYTWYQQVEGPQGFREVVTFTADRHGRQMQYYKNETLMQSLTNLNDGIVSFYDIHLTDNPTFSADKLPGSRVHLLIHPDGTFVPMRTTVAGNQEPSQTIAYPKEHLKDGWKGFAPSSRLIDYLFPRP